MPCLDANLTMVEGWQAPLKDATGNTLALPNPHVITTLERMAELLNQLQPNSPISLGCAATAQALKQDLAVVVGGILSGSAAGLVSLPFPVALP
jgi:hypothetical protein